MCGLAQGAAVLDRRSRHRHGIDRAEQALQNGVAESFNGKFRDKGKTKWGLKNTGECAELY
jgi:hypothetical protein